MKKKIKTIKVSQKVETQESKIINFWADYERTVSLKKRYSKLAGISKSLIETKNYENFRHLLQDYIEDIIMYANWKKGVKDIRYNKLRGK